jgi:ribosomal protein L16 Arg81 hydroxylase
MDFSDLLTPIEESYFFSEYWEKKLLVIQGRCEEYYDELLTINDIDHILTSTWLRSPSLRLVKDGREMNLASYTKSFNWGMKTFRDVIDVPQVISAYLQGVTIVLEALHQYWKPLALFCDALTKKINLRFQSNVYVTPPKAKGLSPHYDSHDVFILQIFGSKCWKFYEPTIQLPNKRFRFNKEKSEIGNLIKEVKIQRGDLVYIPRGYAHEALATKDSSIHITVGINSYEWIELFKTAIDELENAPEFRKSLPPKFLGTERLSPNDKEYLNILLMKFNDLVVSEDLIEKVQDKFLATQSPTFDRYFLAVTNLDNINTQTSIKVRENLTYRIKNNHDRITLYFADKKITFPAYVLTALQFICNKVQLSISEIPDVLDESGKIVLVKVLVKEGFIKLL